MNANMDFLDQAAYQVNLIQMITFFVLSEENNKYNAEHWSWI